MPVRRESLKPIRPKQAPAPKGFDGVLFASAAAERAAVEAGMEPSAFNGAEPSGATGFTVADVRRVAESHAGVAGDAG